MKRPAGVPPPTGQQPEGVSPVVTVTQSTAPRTVTAKSGMILPTTINQQTDMNLITTAVTVFYKQGGCKGSFDTVMRVADAMRDSSAVIVLYVALDGEQAARCLWPNSISFTKDKNLVARCYCTLRGEWKTFRIDRMLTCHPLTTPDDAEPAQA
jgi:predicted DNA-binding transcriptional regulator YafY